MCGRTCLTLQPKEITKACTCKYRSSIEENNKCLKDMNKNIEYEPEYRFEYNCGRKYSPSFNIAPTDITPVIVSADHFYDEEDSKIFKGKRIIVPMMWGMIPFWHKGDWRKHGLSTNNCRLEHMLESKLYKGPFKRGQRCIILCEGFYEWQTTKLAKASEREAYLLHMPQDDKTKIYDRTTWNAGNINLLKMAGLFDVWEDENGDKMYSYSIITFESSRIMSWLHHRMPAILENEEQINNWLDFKNVSNDDALKVLRPASQLQWYRVSNIVNNSRNKSDQCNKPVELSARKKPTMNKLMSAWLNVQQKKECDLKTETTQNYQNEVTSDINSEISPVTKRPRCEDYK